MKKIITILSLVFCAVMLLSTPASALTDVSGSFVIDENGKHITVPVLYEAEK